jgi:SAM-dependent methyltransferase
MSAIELDYHAQAPGNASRFFASKDQARSQPMGTIQLAWHSDDSYVFNMAFNPELTQYDRHYCTSVVDINQVIRLPTTTYFENQIVPYLLRPARSRIVDIGCGQGEFVEFLRGKGFAAEGFDPVLQNSATYLHPRLWSAGEAEADLYIMRCVLPHIPDPWAFLAELAEASPGCRVLVEFQQLEWILLHDLWYQISHDHVNLFRLSDFSDRYEMLANGEFADGEWAWVLIDPSALTPPPPRDAEIRQAIRALSRRRTDFISALTNEDRPVAIWGAAGKGIVLSHALAQVHKDTFAIDADPLRWGLFMEASGISVQSPTGAIGSLPKETLILVCNPNHLADVTRFIDGGWDVSLPSGIT